ncbi:MAG: universal stress protein [Vicinamibacterales bacterium]
MNTQAPSPTLQPQASSLKPRAVLVAVDFGEASARAMGIAGVVASAFGARLLVLHAERFDPPAYFTLEQVARLEAERRAAQAAAAAHLVEVALKDTAYPITPSIVDEPPVDAILHAAATADLIVLGTHGRRGPGRWWLGSVAERVVRAATVPVLVTRAGTSPAGVFERIVLAGDGADPGSAARDLADQLAAAFGGRVTYGGPITHCRPEAMAQATLVVTETRSGHSAWAMTDTVAKVLGSCEHPVLFVPAQSHGQQ